MLVNIGKGIKLTVPTLDTLAPEVRDHIIYLGWRNVLMDSHAGMTAKDSPDDYIEKSRAIAEKKLAALTNGEVRTTSTREGDPVRREAMRLAMAAVEAACKAKGIKATDKAKKEKALANIGTFMAQAEKNVEATKAAATIDMGLDDLAIG